MKVLDLGGTPSYWAAAPQRPAHVTVVNLGFSSADAEVPGVTRVLSDACEFGGADTFDLVVSNSVLEHVGGHYRRRQLAEVCLTSARRVWVQTPYRYFPVEPHWVAPGIQFLPTALRVGAAQWWPMGHMKAEDEEGVVRGVLETELVSITEMRYLFPDCEIRYERFAGLVKSLLAVRT